MCDYDRIGTSDPIGRVTLGYNRKGAEIKHWREMVENPRRPVIHWHILQVRQPFTNSIFSLFLSLLHRNYSASSPILLLLYSTPLYYCYKTLLRLTTAILLSYTISFHTPHIGLRFYISFNYFHHHHYVYCSIILNECRTNVKLALRKRDPTLPL